MFNVGGGSIFVPFDAGLPQRMEPVGCQCQSAPGFFVLLGLVALFLRRPRRSS